MASRIDNVEKEVHVSVFIIFYKLVLGIIELLLAFGIIFLNKQALFAYESIKTKELLEDPNDLLISITDKAVPYLTQHIKLIVIVLFVLGTIKVVGAIGLFYKKRWGLDLLILLTVAILPFQTVDFLIHPTVAKLVFLFFDGIVALYLTQFKPGYYLSSIARKVR